MNYELALSLKEAGFPQILENRIHYRENCEECISGNHEKPMKLDMLDEFDIAIPTLSELIEACGEDFECLKKDGDLWQCGECFYASGGGLDPDLCGFAEKSEGSTPEEAVAKLWLALNKK